MTAARPTREQAAALALLALLILACAGLVGVSLQMWADAADDLADKRAVLAGLARARAGGPAGALARVGRAPDTAFIGAPTQGQAGARLEAYLTRLALDQGAVVMSSAIEPERRGESDAIRLQATLETSPAGLQTLLYQLEAETPYLVVEALAVQPSGGAGQRSLYDAPLRVSLTLRGLWRRGTA